ncbi:universal stress protein [Streptomyces sp. ACA25]|uniref:universal stress protein n=1 Tax=Streptomyces sp. ACA25 TaxID=3022596 RepID=UPI002306F819|nr:universal stress protein [Streptomyces sp. ACA25]MDB1087343.1 universal stress protein [Streptomyces sp. ACA25]
MDGSVTVGVEGQEEGRAAVEWAAQEALSSGRLLRLVHAWGRMSPRDPMLADSTAQQRQADQVLEEAAADLAVRYPGLTVSTEAVAEGPVQALLAASETAGLLVLGTRGLGAFTGFLLGSVSLPVLARARCPVTMVRAGDTDRPRGREVVLGLKRTEHPDEEVLGYAFAAARTRGKPLRVVYAWTPPVPSYASIPTAYVVLPDNAPEATDQMARLLADALTDTLRPWRERYPEVEVIEEPVPGSAAQVLVEAAVDADLVVVGRGGRAAGVGPLVGPVVHALLHHSPCPVVAVPHP